MGTGFAWLSLAVLVACLVTTIVRLHPPARGVGINEERVLGFAERITAEPHASGTPGHARLRDWLVSRLETAGWAVEIQRGEKAHWRDPSTLIPLENLVARLEGTAGTDDALLLVAHYDSRPGPSRGAGDDGAGVAALLEVATQLAEDPPANDVILLLSDGEESGLLGARLWVEETAPTYQSARAVVNVEGRGVRGTSVMFETGRGDRRVVEMFAAVAPHPVTSSLAPAVYEILPNGTDFTAFRYAGGTISPLEPPVSRVQNSPPNLPGLNFAFIDGYEHYHQATDDFEHLSKATLFHQASQAVAVAKKLANEDLVDLQSAGDAIYFDIWSLTVIVYPDWVRWLLLPPAIVVAIVGCVVAGRRERRVGAWLKGLGLLVGVLVAAIAWPQVAALAMEHPAVGGGYPLAYAGAALLATGWVAFAAKSAEIVTIGLTAGAVMLSVATALWLPGGSYLPLAVTVAGGVTLLASDSWAKAVALAFVALTTVLLTFASWMFGLALTLGLPGPTGFLLAVTLLLWLPHVRPLLERDRPRWIAGGSLAAIGTGLLVVTIVAF